MCNVLSLKTQEYKQGSTRWKAPIFCALHDIKVQENVRLNSAFLPLEITRNRDVQKSDHYWNLTHRFFKKGQVYKLSCDSTHIISR